MDHCLTEGLRALTPVSHHQVAYLALQVRQLEDLRIEIVYAPCFGIPEPKHSTTEG